MKIRLSTYHTAAGLVLSVLGRLPERGDVVERSGWKLEVAAMDGLGSSASSRGAHRRPMPSEFET